MPQNSVICPTTVNVCIARFTRLNADGTVATPPNNAYVTDAIQKVVATPQYDAGVDVTLLNGCNAVRATYKTPDRFKRWDFALDFVAQEPALMELLLGSTLLLDGSTIPVASGWSWPEVGSSPPPVAGEFWQDNWLNDGLAATPQRYSRYIYPMMFLQPAADTLEGSLKTQSMQGQSRQNAQWASGPYGDQVKPGGLVAQAVGKNGGVLWSDTLPAAVCGYKATTSGSL